ncbi:zinc finger and BTB domain-containing protein 34 isoform X2 [Pseudoliparis swirei]|uniref:zinc finger and BTB domain-containing protein 34 isoform X2 n=1 Tax=Pseudoliparis swirei TaxID=2059687 RepID=UPI0024BEEB84|nr:zinc finger and BTB domain-containing protein 34 isoform X2 [Pseudoliparis swirei]
MLICKTAAKLEKHIQEMDDGSYIEFDVPEFSNTVLTQLNELRLQGKLCDIIVHIQGQPFRAHKAVLAASSPYFRDHSALNTMSGLSISVIKNPEVFEQLLSFCYTGHMSLQLKDIISFLTAASFLQMQAIIDKCTQILESIHSKISPPYYSRQPQTGHEARFELAGKGPGRGRQQPEEGQSDRGSSDSVSEHDAPMEAETEQVELIGKDGQVTDVHVKIEKTDRPTYSDSSSAGDDGYHTELVDGEQVVAVSVGSYGSVIQSAAYSYSGLSSPCFVNLTNSSPSRSMLSGYRGGRARAKRPVAIPAGVLSLLKPGSDDSESAVGATGLENDVRERSLRSQWYPYNERLICMYCGKTFNQKGSLDRHMRLHMGITPFVCKFCGKKYTRKDQLEYHIRGHTDNKPFHCQICGKCFPFQGTLNQHLRKKHMGATDGSNHVDSSKITAGSTGPKDRADTTEAMAFEAQYAEEAPAPNMEESSKCSPDF